MQASCCCCCCCCHGAWRGQGMHPAALRIGAQQAPTEAAVQVQRGEAAQGPEERGVPRRHLAVQPRLACAGWVGGWVGGWAGGCRCGAWWSAARAGADARAEPRAQARVQGGRHGQQRRSAAPQQARADRRPRSSSSSARARPRTRDLQVAQAAAQRAQQEPQRRPLVHLLVRGGQGADALRLVAIGEWWGGWAAVARVQVQARTRWRERHALELDGSLALQPFSTFGRCSLSKSGHESQPALPAPAAGRATPARGPAPRPASTRSARCRRR